MGALATDDGSRVPAANDTMRAMRLAPRGNAHDALLPERSVASAGLQKEKPILQK